MAKGKQTCKILKEIRKQIAEENDIELITSECTYKGDCLGTCPKCEAEVRYLERELEKRQRMGKAAVIAGLSVSTFAAASCAGCGPVQPLAGMPADAFDSSKVTCSDTIDKEPLAGDVEMVVPVVQRTDPDTVVNEPLMGLVPMFNEHFSFDAEQYQALLKDHFVYPDMENLTVDAGDPW